MWCMVHCNFNPIFSLAHNLLQGAHIIFQTSADNFEIVQKTCSISVWGAFSLKGKDKNFHRIFTFSKQNCKLQFKWHHEWQGWQSDFLDLNRFFFYFSFLSNHPTPQEVHWSSSAQCLRLANSKYAIKIKQIYIQIKEIDKVKSGINYVKIRGKSSTFKWWNPD